MKFKSLTTRVTLLYGLLILLICAGLGLCSILSSSDALKTNIDESLEELAYADSRIISEMITGHLNSLKSLANSPWIKNDDLTTSEKLALLQDEVERSGHKSMMIADTNGNAKTTVGGSIDVSNQEYFIKALSGQSNISDPLISDMGGGIFIVLAVPIKDGETVKGVLIARRDGNELSNYVTEMQYNKQEIYMLNDKGTTIAHSDKSRVMEMYNIFEQYAADPGLESVYNFQKKMAEGETGVEEYTYKGVTKYVAFHPVDGTNWSLGVAAPKSVIMAKVDDLSKLMKLISAAFLIFSIGLTILIARKIARPIKETTKHLNAMATGDFTADISKKLLAEKDEIGNLANSLDKMQSSIRTMMKAVLDESSNVSQMLTDINKDMHGLDENIEEISATTEQLSAGTEEMAASSEEMNATSLEIEKAIESVASKAQDGVIIVNKVSVISEQMREGVIASRQEALNIYGKAKVDLENAIEQSKAVDQINELSNAILDITSQTNLLALNAAIEAARAGEAGRGFAVVADEIRTLAESSKNSVSRIQEVTKDVLAVVNGLTSSSMEVMEFIDKKVLKDYDGVVQTSERYNEISTEINDIVTGFSSTSEELLAAIQNMVQAITQVATSADEEAMGAANIARKTSVIAGMAENVVNLASKSNEKSELLIELVNQFKI